MHALDALISPHRESTTAAFLDHEPPADYPDVWGIAGRLVAGQLVSIGELNQARTALGRQPFDVPCRCPNDDKPGLCRCGLTLWRDGEAAYLEELRLDEADRVLWAAHAEAQDQYEADLDAYVNAV